jgi:enterochelin esterase-like enzyme
MNTRQATKKYCPSSPAVISHANPIKRNSRGLARNGGSLLVPLLAFIAACSSSNEPIPTLAGPTPAHTPSPTLTSTPTLTPTPTPLSCLTQLGTVEEGSLETSAPPLKYFIYLPPCYAEKTEKRYPVLYLLHGQTFTADQWIRLGTVDVMNELILSGEIMPFIIVFPEDRYWNQPSGAGFGDRLTNDLIPYIDLTYRTNPDPRYRAIGGMSRGAGWALQLGLTRPDLFSIIGLHSLAAFQRDAAKIDDWILAIPPDSRPTVFMDIGEDDRELKSVQRIEAQFTEFDLTHEWHLYTGGHTEEYWSAHVEAYLQWYAGQWK